MASKFSSILDGLSDSPEVVQKFVKEQKDGNGLVQIRKRTPKEEKLGCDFCPANKKRVKKIFAEVKGRSVFVVAQNPGVSENEEGRALVGKSGQFLWKELKKVGIRRKDCDVTNAVRCLCYDEVGTQGPISRTPNRQEIKCCSVHTKNELEQSKAKIFLVFGSLAAKQVFGGESTKKVRMFWSEKLQARVYVLDHPAYFLRGGNRQRLREFRAALKAAGADFQAIQSGKKKSFSRYAYLDEQDYEGIFTYAELRAEVRRIRKAAEKGIRITVDTEEDVIDGKKVLLGIGFCYKAGRARTVVLDHPLAPHRTRRELRRMKNLCANVISSNKIKKAFQHGSHDCTQIKNLLGVRVKGYDYDTEYAEYMSNPNRKAFGLDEVINARFQNFSGYKSIVMPEAAPQNLDREALGYELPKGFDKLPLVKRYDFFRKKGLLRYSQIPIDKFVKYNCADCDVTKRIEVTTNKKIPYQLLQVYIDCGFVLDRMQGNGPIFDFDHARRLEEFYPPRAEWLLSKLRKMSGNPTLNPNSSPQITKYIYDELKLHKHLDDGREKNTRKSTMEVLSRVHKFPGYLLEYRRIAKIISTYLTGFTKCATANDGRLRTKWWLTGTSTGRLSSGGGKNKRDDDITVVNLQNIHGDPYIQDCAVPDERWRKLYAALLDRIASTRTGDRHLLFLRKSIRRWYLEKDKDEKGKIWKYLDGVRHATIDDLAKIALDDAFIKKYGDISVLLGYDFGQVEIRVAAQASGDENLIADCTAGDIHSTVGHFMTGWPIEKIKKDKKTRTLTKNVHFGILYGLAAAGLVSFLKAKDPNTEITIELAEEYIANYFKRYRKMRKFIERCWHFVEENGYIENMFGFRRPLDAHAGDRGGWDSEGAENESGGGAFWKNQAVNTPIQGAAHQLMLMALSAMFRKKSLYVKTMGWPGLEVHDALYFFPKLKNLVEAQRLGKQLLETEPLEVVKTRFPKIKWKVPLQVEGKAGLRLGDTVETEGMSLTKILYTMALETYVREQLLRVEMKYQRK